MITHDRWPKIKAIFHSAQERPLSERPEFLSEACGGDESIREDLEALLTADASNEDFLSAPAYEFAAGMLADEASEFSAGQEVGRYTILCLLGSGGMGQIYLAEDAQLGRKIALKLISSEFATDARRVFRFEREARAASALNHPNICVIHEVGKTASGRHFIAMEHIQGITLRDQLSRGTLPVLQALNVATQVAAALSTAHAHGIVHRDIKPENIMLRPDGYVKVLDFGLAKLTEILPEPEGLREVSTNVRTEAGTLMGTIKYMSPEQLREARVDERTDIWSLGVVLFEMLRGLTPFEARTSNDTVAAILGTQPTSLKFPDGLPTRLRDIVMKALEKDSNSRYQTVTQLAVDLRKLQRELQRQADSHLDQSHGIQSPLVPSPLRRDEQPTRKVEGSAIFTRIKSQAISSAELLLSEIRSHKTAALFTGASGVLVLLLLIPNVGRVISRIFSPRDGVQTVKMKALTNAGTSVCAAISFDGKLVAHAEERDGKQRLVVTSTATSAASVVVPAADVQYLGLSFSHDNNYLYFTRKDKNDGGSLYRLALPGNDPIRVKSDVDSPISFSPQQDRFAFVRLNDTTSEYSLVLANVNGSHEEVLATRKNGDTFSVHGLAWSPDGNLLVCPTSSWTNGFSVKLVGIDLKSGREQAIGNQWWFSILQIAWQEDMSSLIISAREQPSSPFQLWRITYPDGAAHRITTDLAEYRGVSLSDQQIVTIRSERSWRLWVTRAIDGSERPAAIASGVGLSYGLSWAGNERVVFSSMAQDRLNISRVDLDGSHFVQLTIDAGDNYTPAASADGRFIVFASNRTGSFNIWRMNPEDGSDLKQLTFSDANFYPTVSADDRWVAYDNQINTKLSVWKVPLDGGDPQKVTEKYRMPAFSPDDELIACRYDLESGSRDVAIVSAQGGPPLKIVQIPILEWQRVQWYGNNHTLSYIKNVNGYSNIWSYDLDTGSEKQLTSFAGDQIYAYAWSPDYKSLASQRGLKTSNVAMISNDR